MEVGEHGPDYAEIEARIDKNVSFTGAGNDSAMRRVASDEFEGADGGGADRDDAAAGLERAVDLDGGGFGEEVELFVEAVILDTLRADGLEGAEPDVERDLDGFDAASLELAEDFGCEVESGGGGSDGTALAGVDGLVTVAVGGTIVAGDVGGEWDMTERFERREEIRHRSES
jgi:hypothetical protein